jgi:hypothetical protein
MRTLPRREEILSMSKNGDSGWYLAIVALFCFVPCAFSQEMQINDPPSNNVMDGIYVGSYSANDLTTGSSVQITCDDFKDNSDYNAANYTTNTFSTLGSTLWGSYLMSPAGGNDTLGQVTALYDDVAWLTMAMVKQTGTEQGYYSYAIWAIFAPNEVAAWLTSYGDAAACNAVFGSSSSSASWGPSGCTANTKYSNGLVETAMGDSSSVNTSNIIILTPKGCTNGPGTCPEQEFIEIVAEGGSAALYLLLAGMACFGAMFVRSRTLAHPAGRF